MPIAVIVGGLGSGKTLCLTHEIFYFLKNGYEIFTNYKLKQLPHTLIKNRKDIIRYGMANEKQKFIGLDEGYLLFDALEKSSNKQQEFRNIVNITRKMHCVLYFTSQTVGQINLRSQLLFDYMLHPFYDKKRDILKVTYYLKDIHGMFEPYKRIKHRNISQFFQFYDTDEIINDFIRGILDDKEQEQTNLTEW